MVKMIIVELLILLCVANVLLLCALAHSGRGVGKSAKMGLCIMSAVLILDMLFSVGGVALW